MRATSSKMTKASMMTQIFVMIGAVTAASLYMFWRVDQVQQNVATVNQFYVPVLKHLNLLSGKWSAYQRSFEQIIGFRKWGSKQHDSGVPKLHLRKMVDSNLVELSKRLNHVLASRSQVEVEELRSWMEHLSLLADHEAVTVTEITSFVKAKHFEEAAAAYARARQDHIQISQELATLVNRIENKLVVLQLSTEQELGRSQNVMLVLLAASLIFSMVVLYRLRRWILPIVEWTRVAQEIALKGTHRDVKFPQITGSMPPEMSLLTREFTRMGMTVLERERTIHQQKERLESLNQHLKEQNEMLQKLGGLNERVLNSMSAGLLAVNAQGLIEQFNERYCELFDADRTRILGLYADDVLQMWPAEWVAQWLGAQESLHFARLKQGHRVFDVRLSHLHEQAGRLLLFEDVTHLVEAEEKLEHARKLVLAGNLSSQVAHEVRNPLNSMSLQLEMLEEDLSGVSKDNGVSERIKAIGEQVQRLDRITRRYLDVGRTPLQKTDKVDLHALLERSIVFLSGEIQAAGVRIQFDLQARQDVVRGDGDALSQVIFNLVRNAIEELRDLKMPEGQEKMLRMTTRNDQGFIRVSIADSGPGIRSEMKNRLFEPFVTHKTAGHGLGLSVSRQICIEHGGELKLVEGSMASGAVFEFSIPLLREEVQPHIQA